MSKIKTLEELAQLETGSEYGLKAEGLGKLQRIIPTTGYNLKTTIPDVFALPENFDLESEEVRSAYFNLTKDFNAPRIIMARSSDKDERPGKFESHTSLYNPENPEESFENWKNAARKVKKSGASALFGQPMVGDLEDFPYSFNSKNEECKIKSFGGTTSSFVFNSVNPLRGSYFELACCFGIATKLVRGDMDTCVIQETEKGFKIVNLNHNYKEESFAYYSQGHIEIVAFDDPGYISGATFHKGFQIGTLVGESYTPFYPFAIEDVNSDGKSKIRFEPINLIIMLGKIKRKCGAEVEIEGCVDKDGVHLFQLREYNLPSSSLTELSKVSNDRIIMKDDEDEEVGSFGFNQIRGDLYVSNDLVDVPKNGIPLITGYHRTGELKKYSKVAMLRYESGGINRASHEFGNAVQRILELEENNIEAMILDYKFRGLGSKRNLEKFPEGRVEFKDSPWCMIYHDVTIECTGGRAQIYFND